MLHLGQTLSSTLGILPPGAEHDDEEQLHARVDKRKQELLSKLRELVTHNKERIGRHQWALLTGARKLVMRMSRDLKRLDADKVARKQLKIDKKTARARRGVLNALSEDWFERQKLIVERADLGLRLSTFQQRLTSVVERDKAGLTAQHLERRVG